MAPASWTFASLCFAAYADATVSPGLRGSRQAHGLAIAESNVSEAVLTPDRGTPGWLIERMFHEEPVWCPWQTPGSLPDADCKMRSQRIKSYQDALAVCEGPLQFTEKSIGHRGAALVAPEETLPSWQIGAQSGAGYLECDVSVTNDLDFTCRHSNCDLDFTTDLVAKHPDLNAKCLVPFVPSSGVRATCCTFDFTMEELSRLCSKMESAVNASASTYDGYLLGPPGFRTGTIAERSCIPLVSYREYLRLLKRSGYNVIPEIKDTWYNRTQNFLASKNTTIYALVDRIADMMSEEGFKPWPAPEAPDLHSDSLKGILQTFDHRVATYLKKTRPELSVEYMWESDQTRNPDGVLCAKGNGDLNGNIGGNCAGKELLKSLAALGVDLFSPPIAVLIAPGPHRRIVPSNTTALLKQLRVRGIGAYSLERDGCKVGDERPVTPEAPGQLIAPCGDPSGFYFGSVEGTSTFQHVDVLDVLDVLFRDIGLKGLFSDFPATVSAYVNCILEPALIPRASGSAQHLNFL